MNPIDGSAYQAGDFAQFPWSPEANPAYLCGAMHFCKRYGVPGADTAWDTLIARYWGRRRG